MTVEQFLRNKGFYCMATKGRITELQCKYSRVRGQLGRSTKNLEDRSVCSTKCNQYRSPKKGEVEEYKRLVTFKGTKAKQKEIDIEREFDEANISRGSTLKRIFSEESDG